jgi:hypothetical protein
MKFQAGSKVLAKRKTNDAQPASPKTWDNNDLLDAVQEASTGETADVDLQRGGEHNDGSPSPSEIRQSVAADPRPHTKDIPAQSNPDTIPFERQDIVSTSF